MFEAAPSSILNKSFLNSHLTVATYKKWGNQILLPFQICLNKGSLGDDMLLALCYYDACVLLSFMLSVKSISIERGRRSVAEDLPEQSVVYI